MIEIKEMQPQDCHEVWLLQRDCFSHPWSESGIEEMFCTPGYHNLILCQKKRVIGYIGMKSVMDEADITNVAIAPDCRRQGMGKMLLERLLEDARDKKIERIYLEVRVSNEAAMALYEQAGFCQVGIRKNYYEKPMEDARIMMWELTARP
ncbi:MAG: ribosomal protein S18-alanine N-acetyltransferase [Eubacteriales bacterium]|nr:ribosomal protein S18-alanine N-acetyltransferase [Eubacteriales bacterium]